MTDNDIINYFAQFVSNRQINWKKLPKDIEEYLKNRYNDNSTNLLKESYARIKNNIEILPECPICHKKHTFINRLDKFPYPIYCSNKCKGESKEWINKQKETKKELYGNANYNNRKKYKETCLEKYGCENVYQNDEIKNKIKDIKKEKYGDEYYNNREQVYKTNLKNLGVKMPFQSKEILNKCNETLKIKYGENVHNPMDLEFVKNKIRNTCLERYGVDWITKTDWYVEKTKNTLLERYGVDSYSKSKEWKEHIQSLEYQIHRKQQEYITKKKNKSFCGSKEENLCFELIKEKYTDAVHQFRDNKRYPFNCDIYIPSLDLFIEYQGSEFHGRKPYEGTEEDLQKIKLWKERGDEICKQENKHGSRYHAMINTWTIGDVNKRNIAKQNNLNYIEFWNINEVKEWLNIN